MLDLLQFLGPFHPVVLHFPIAFLLLATAIQLINILLKQDWMSKTIWLLLLTGSSTAVVAATLGYLLSLSGDYDAETVSIHMRYGITVALLSVLATVFKAFSRGRARRVAAGAYGVSLLSCAFAVLMAGHYGGTLTHSEGFLTRNAPAWLVAGFGKTEQIHTEGASDDGSLFTSSIEPILRRHCYQCHSAVKQRGELRLDDRASALRGGKSGIPSIQPEDALGSEIIRRLTLLPGDKKVMPPEGKAALSPEDLVTLITWIQSGAPWTGEQAGPRLLAADTIAKGITPVSETALKALRSSGTIAVFLSEKNRLLRIDSSNADVSAETLFAGLSGLEQAVTWLDVTRKDLDPRHFQAIGSFTNLTRLNLAETPVRDTDLQVLQSLSNIVSLNLIGTKITDQGIEHLTHLSELRNLYIWRTSISSSGVLRLKNHLPDLKIIGAAPENDNQYY